MPIAVTAPFVTLTFNLSRSSKVKPMGRTPWLLPFLTYFTSKSMTLIFDPSRSSKVKCDGAIWKPVGRTCKRSRWSNLVSVTVFEIFRVKILTFHLLTLIRLTPEPKVTKMGDDVPSTLVYHTKKLQPDRANCVRNMCYQIFSAFGPWGLTPGQKFTKRGEDLADSEIYHPAKFRCSTPTHAWDIRY